MVLAALPALVLLLGAASSAHATSSFYWYGNGDSTCWQTGQLGSPSETCSSVGPGYLPTPGNHTNGLEWMLNDTENGIGKDLTLSPSGDYCSYYRLGGELKYQDSTNEGSTSGLTTSTPYSSYQEGDKTSSAYNDCQAQGTYWGQAVRGPSGKGCTETCGMHHYVSFKSQGESDQPWSGVFGEPSLVLSAEAGVATFTHTGTSYGGWGYVCPELEDTEPSFHGVIEYCFQEWRSANNASEWKNERKGECNSPFSMVNTYFWPGTTYATEMSGSANTFEVGSGGSGHFEAKITKTNLINTVKLLNKECAGWNLSENPEKYALVGVEQGLEGWSGVSVMGGWGHNLQLHTEYTQLPPTVTTGTATGVQFKRGTLNGTVNPNGDATNYYFQYGETTSYGSIVPAGGAGVGSGGVPVPVSNTITELKPGTTYHYRVVAANYEGQNSYGSDQVFTTATPPSLSISKRFQSSMTLSWTGSANASSYTIKRNGATITSTAALTDVDTKLQATTFYSYEVVANEESESAGSNTVTRATTPLDTVAVDVNGDKKTDLAYIFPGSYLDSFLSKGNGTYESKSEYLKEFESSQGLWLSGDFNGDGKGDLVYIYPGAYIDTFLSKGNGTYEEKSEQISKEFNSTGGTWEVGDFNGDGKSDLAYIYPGSYIYTFLSNGNGTYEEKVEHLEGFDSTSGKWFTGDFNGDGKTDLAYIYPGGYIDTFLSKGNGTYEEKSELIEKSFDDVTGKWLTGDFNGDGKADLAYIYPGSYIYTFLSNGNGTYEKKSEHLEGFDATSGQWLTGDANGDGKTDLFYIYPGSYIDTFLSKGNGTYESKSEHLEGFDAGSGLWL